MADTVLIVPPTSENTIIFHFNQGQQKWERGDYHPQLTGGRATTQEINQVLTEIENTYAPINSKLTKTGIFFFASIFLIGGVASLTLDINNPKTIQIFAMLFMAYLFTIIATLFKLSQQFRLKCQPLVDHQINQRFIPRGLRWHLPANFPFWIELHNDYLRHQPANNLPPVQQQQQANPNYGAPQQNVGGQLYPQLPPVQPQNNNIYMPPSQH